MTAGIHVEGIGLTGADRSPSVTVVVPTKNAARTLAACLASLRSQTYPCRTVVVDNGSTDATVAIAERGADVVLHAGPERSAQRNHGARAYSADVVGFVDADMVLAPTVVAEAMAAIGEGAGSVIVPERTVGTGFWVEVRAFERSFYDGSDAIEAARFFAWDVFERTGGFDEQITGGEDRDLSESARQLAPVARTTAMIEHDEGTIGYLDACRKKAYYAEGVRRYVAKRGICVLRDMAARPWLREPTQLFSPLGVGLAALKVGETAAVVARIVRVRCSGNRIGRAFRKPNGAADVVAGITGQPPITMGVRRRGPERDLSRSVSLVERILRRSGTLTFQSAIDAGNSENRDVRHGWLADWTAPFLTAAQVADVGCWTGELLVWARREGAAKTVGLDIEGPWLEVARKRSEIDEVLEVSSLETLPLSLLGGFDLVFFLETLEHLPRGTEADALRSMASMLAPGGQMIMSTPVAGIAALADPAWLLVGHRHYRPVTLVALLGGAGLRVEEVKYSGNLWTSIDTLWFYTCKHLLAMSGLTAHNSWLETRGATGLQRTRRFSSTNVWLRARRSQVSSTGSPEGVVSLAAEGAATAVVAGDRRATKATHGEGMTV